MFSSISRKCDLLLRPSGVLGARIRQKTQKFKKKIVKHLPKKTPTALALDHFDFYYGPMFGKLWPSVRVGLLTPNKYIAVVNAFSESFEVSEGLLREHGSLDLLLRLQESTSAEALKKRRRLASERDAEVLKSGTEEDLQSKLVEEDFSDMRDESGLQAFHPSGKTFTLGDVKLGKAKIRNRDVVITGLEGQFVELPKQEDVITYPKHLKLFVYDRGDVTDFPSPDKDRLGVPSWWLLDGGSVVPVLALNLTKGETMLDMCAAPGGKSLLAIQTMLLGKLVCNDFKMSRLGQLRSALASFIPSNIDIANRVILKKKNAADIVAWDELDVYDKVLVDAPCTTDRHSLNSDEGNLFSTAMTNERLNLPQLQTKLLINALRAVRRGGAVVYSTCSLSPAQNEAVIENAVAVAAEKFGIRAVELSLTQLETDLGRSGLFRFADQCRRGSLVLPFLLSNFGPMYVCKLQRTA